MSTPVKITFTRQQVLALHLKLLRATKNVKLTDQDYLRRRITYEFKKHKDMDNDVKVAWAYEVR